jgi:hypothetical protein
MTKEEKLEGKPAPKRVYFFTKEVLLRQKRKREEKAKQKAKEKRRAHNVRKQKKKTAEQRLYRKPAKDMWKDKRKQYEMFMVDVLLPRADIEWTKHTKIWAAYELYCAAVGQPKELGNRQLSALLRENFCWKTAHDGVMFGLRLKDVFVKIDEEVKINE